MNGDKTDRVVSPERVPSYVKATVQEVGRARKLFKKIVGSFRTSKIKAVGIQHW